MRADIVRVSLCDGAYVYDGLCMGTRGHRTYVLCVSSGARIDLRKVQVTVLKSRPTLRKARFDRLFDESRKFAGNRVMST
ncbi:hypothetical protein [Ottowia sp.]|uniref:hypothetical protein n=1 Tax=Ottowia sp. TaxID=1898956 RepID=UPI0025F94423|nr:hypothetical protein [Ottowia sp.]MBK6616535.1 hypothetical protein [Ottowia sp.]